VYKTEYDANKSLLASGVSQPWGWDHVEQGAYIFAPDGPDLSRVNDMVAGAANGSKNSYYCHDSWGSARINCNVQLIAMILDKLTDKDAYADWAKYQMSLILGGNSTGKNLVCGYNEKSPKNPHHRAASGFSGWDQFNSNAPEKYTLYGALCGGPTSTDFSTYQDKVNDSTSNEVTLDYNAGMVGAAAALYLKNKKSTDKGLSEQMTITGLPGMSSDAKIYGYKDGKAVDPDAKPEEIIEPSEDPTAEPTAEPTLDPGNTTDPTLKPTEEPSASPSVKPTEEPSANPSVMPTAEPTLDPTAAPDTPAPTPVTPTASPAPSSDPNISDTITILDSNDLSKYQSKTTASAGTGSSGQGQTAGTGTSSGTESSASAGIPKGVPVIVNNYTTVVNYNYTPDTMVVGSDTDNYYVNIKVRGAGVIPVKKIYTSAPKKTFSIYKLPAGAKVTSSNKKAVKVLKNGRLKTGKRGRSKITIQTGGAAYSFTVKVNRSAIKKVRFTSKLKRLKTGKRVRLSAKTLLGRKYTRGNLIFKVNAANRADILADGTLSAKSKGIVKVTAYATDGSGRRAVMKVRII
ncbi:MAG: glycoside hydrolase family 9 protein, partial [Lachnospiraceae bacterium]|nr:glycoside hydrolase family 9 protein [Lachnospiraceae bacterium]